MFLLARFQIRQKQWIFTLQSNIHESWSMIGHRARKFYKEVIFVREKYKYFPLFCLGEINLRKKAVKKKMLKKIEVKIKVGVTISFLEILKKFLGDNPIFEMCSQMICDHLIR